MRVQRNCPVVFIVVEQVLCQVYDRNVLVMGYYNSGRWASGTPPSRYP